MDKLDKLYAEGCNFVRHYSNCSLNVRNAALVQGLILISACGYIFVNRQNALYQNPVYLILTSAFGLLLTGLLYSLHRGYVYAADTYAEETAKIEPKFGSGGGPVVGYERVRTERYKSLWFRLITIHATFTVIALPFVVFLLVGIYRAFSVTATCGSAL